MKPQTVAAHATHDRPNRILILLAAAWMIFSLAIGGTVMAESREPDMTETVTGVVQAVDQR